MIKELFGKKNNHKHMVDLPHDQFFNNLIADEYKRLGRGGHTYLDYTGGNLYAESQIIRHHHLLKNHVFGNPHSTNPTSQYATRLADNARKKIIQFFNAEDYHCIFTQNATGAIKLVGECYPFDHNSSLLLLTDNHNSVNGIREYCANKGGTFEYSPIHYHDLTIDPERLNELLKSKPACSNKLFAFPAQSNVSGVKHDLGWVKKAKINGWDVLLDAAAYVPTSKLDLAQVKPDFVSVSFYKIFGYPTGIGCLLVHKSKFHKLRKPWFAGGTITVVSVKTRNHYLAGNHERFENGTINYLDIPAIKIGLEFIESIGMDRINERVNGLINFLVSELRSIRHNSGQKVVKIFGPKDRKNTGGTVIMNFFDREGNRYPFEEVERMANARLISIRSGCFCNPGIDEVNQCLTTEELSRYFSGRVYGEYYDMVNFLNKMRGSTRVSLGIATRMKDLATYLSFVKSFKNKAIHSSIINGKLQVA